MPRTISPDDVRQDVERVVAELDRVPTRSEYDEHGEYSSMTVAKKFADGESLSFNNAVAALGYDEPEDPRRVSAEALRQDFEQVVDELGRVPTSTEYSTHGEYSVTTLVNRVGDDTSHSYVDAVRAMGYDPRFTSRSEAVKQRAVDADTVRQDFERVVDELGHVPSATEYNNHGEYSSTTLANRFAEEGSQSYNEAVQELGYEPRHDGQGSPRIPAESVRADFEQVVDELGRVPRRAEYDETGEYSSYLVIDRFGGESETYEAAVEALGYTPPDPYTPSSVSPEDVAQDFERLVEKLGRVPTWTDYAEHGQYSVGTLKRKFTSAESPSYDEVVAALGYDPPASQRGATVEEVREDFERVAEEVGGSPAQSTYAKRGKYTPTTVAGKLGDGSYQKAVQAIGYDDTPARPGARRIPDERVLADFEQVVDDLGRPPTLKEYETHGTYSSTTVANRFDETESGNQTYYGAVESLGYELPENRGRGIGPIPAEDIREDVERVADKLGHPPTKDEYDEHGEYGVDTVGAKFTEGRSRSYYQALDNLGYSVDIPRESSPRIEDDALRADVERVVDELGHPPTKDEYDEHGEYSSQTLAARFTDGDSASYYDALATLGYDVDSTHSRVTDEELRDDVARVTDLLGHPPYRAEYDEHGEYSSQTLATRFTDGDSASYYDALDNLGYTLGGDAEPLASLSLDVDVDAAEVDTATGTPQIQPEALQMDFTRVAAELGHTPTVEEYDTYGEYSPSTFVRRFSENKRYHEAVTNLGFDWE